MKRYIFLFVYILALGCTRSPETEEKTVKVTFHPELDFTMTPFSSARSFPKETEIIGLVYWRDNLAGVITYEEGNYSSYLQLGNTYSIVFLGNAVPFIKQPEKLSTAVIEFANIKNQQFGDEIFISPIIEFTPKDVNSTINIELKRKIGAISFSPNKSPLGDDIKNMNISVTNIAYQYSISKNCTSSYKNVNLTTGADDNYSCIIYTFVDAPKICSVSSVITYMDYPDRTWYMGEFTPVLNQQYCLTGSMQPYQN